jgi:hypothetical protein
VRENARLHVLYSGKKPSRVTAGSEQNDLLKAKHTPDLGWKASTRMATVTSSLKSRKALGF